MEREAIFGEMLSMAQATHRNGGIVIVQVARLAQRGTLPAKQVKSLVCWLILLWLIQHNVKPMRWITALLRR